MKNDQIKIKFKYSLLKQKQSEKYDTIQRNPFADSKCFPSCYPVQ